MTAPATLTGNSLYKVAGNDHADGDRVERGPRRFSPDRVWHACNTASGWPPNASGRSPSVTPSGMASELPRLSWPHETNRAETDE